MDQALLMQTIKLGVQDGVENALSGGALAVAIRKLGAVQKDRIAELETKIAFIERCKEIQQATLPQDGSRGQANAWDQLAVNIATLETQLAAAQADVGRVDWLEKQEAWLPKYRAAIDAAMKETKAGDGER